MNKILLLNIYILLFSFTSFSQNIDRGFKFLEKLEYEKAKKVFEEIYEADNQNPAANFGMALIYSDDQSSFFNMIQAWHHCRILKSNLDKIQPEQLECIGEYFKNTEKRPSSRPVKKKIDYAIEIIESHFIKYIREENNLELANEVIEKYPDFKYYDNVMHIRNHLEFRKYEKQNTLEGYIEFLEKYPDAAQVEEAIRYRNKLAYESACKTNTIEAFNKYLKDYPDAEEYNLALKKRNSLAFSKAKTINTMQSYDEFINKYPDALEVAEARQMQKQLLYEYAKRIKTLEAYNEFIRKYPEGQQYIDIFNLKSLDLGNKYISASSISSNNIQWVRSFELGGIIEKTGTVEILPDNNYLLTLSSKKADTLFSDIWLLKLTNDGSLLWKKSVGEAYDDMVLMSQQNTKNEIVFSGYTWSGIDSSARNVWIFKQDMNGKNIWSNKIEKWNINTLIIDKSNNILIGGYEVNDSLKKRYRITVLNDAGRKLWSRTYTAEGEVKFLGVLPDNNVLVIGTNWSFIMDGKGYLSWEQMAPTDMLNYGGVVLQNGEYYIIGFKNNNLLFSKYGTDRKKKSEKQYPLQEKIISVDQIILSDAGKGILLLHLNKEDVILFFNTLDGTVTKTLNFSPGRIKDLAIDNNKNLLLLLEDMNSILIKYAGTDF
jgi:tetratricopeptide (TPR) repeat protein